MSRLLSVIAVVAICAIFLHSSCAACDPAARANRREARAARLHVLAAGDYERAAARSAVYIPLSASISYETHVYSSAPVVQYQTYSGLRVYRARPCRGGNCW